MGFVHVYEYLMYSSILLPFFCSLFIGYVEIYIDDFKSICLRIESIETEEYSIEICV